jgi:hypothetical protein
MSTETMESAAADAVAAPLDLLRPGSAGTRTTGRSASGIVMITVRS